MYWPEASALGQFQAKAFIYILQASHTAEKFDLSSVKNNGLFFPVGSQRATGFFTSKSGLPSQCGDSVWLECVWCSRASSQHSTALSIIPAAGGAVLNSHSFHLFARPTSYFRIPAVFEIHFPS